MIKPGGGRAIITENLLLRQQLIIHSRSRQRSPNLTTRDRVLLGFWTLFMNPRRIARSAIIIKPATLFGFHAAMKKRKYRNLYSAGGSRKPGPKGPSKEVMPDTAGQALKAIVGMKQRNLRYGCSDLSNRCFHTMRSHFAFPGVRQWWMVVGKAAFSSEFVDFVESGEKAAVLDTSSK